MSKTKLTVEQKAYLSSIDSKKKRKKQKKAFRIENENNFMKFRNEHTPVKLNFEPDNSQEIEKPIKQKVEVVEAFLENLKGTGYENSFFKYIIPIGTPIEDVFKAVDDFRDKKHNENQTTLTKGKLEELTNPDFGKKEELDLIIETNKKQLECFSIDDDFISFHFMGLNEEEHNQTFRMSKTVLYRIITEFINDSTIDKAYGSFIPKNEKKSSDKWQKIADETKKIVQDILDADISHLFFTYEKDTKCFVFYKDEGKPNVCSTRIDELSNLDYGAISERIFNDSENLGVNIKNKNIKFYLPKPKTYTQEDMEKCFNEARLTTHPLTASFKHENLASYLKSLSDEK